MGDRCSLCNNQGIIILNGNIDDHITNHGMDLWNAYKWLKDYSMFPGPGGWLNQTSKFIHCVKWVDLINLKYEKYHKRGKEQKASFMKRFGNMLKEKRGKK